MIKKHDGDQFFLSTAVFRFIEMKKPLATLGSLISQSQAESICALISHVIKHEDPLNQWVKVEAQIRSLFCVLRPSSKHMSGRQATFESGRAKMAA